MRTQPGVIARIGACLLLAVLLAACTATQPAPAAPGSIARRILDGFWHGFISPITFIVSIFSDQVRIYAYPNGGWSYDLGFMLGIGGLSGGVLSGSTRSRR